MSVLEHFGINIDSIKAKLDELFTDSDILVVSRSSSFSSDCECLVSYKSGNNDLPVDSIADVVAQHLHITRDDVSDNGEYLLIRKA